MNKQELIKKYKELWNEHSPFHEPVPYTSMVELFLKELKQLDEPQPVKVPQFVADWYEKKKHDLNHYIWDYIYNWNHQEESEFKRWMNCSITTFQTLVNMHQFGYEVEKESRYMVKIKCLDSDNRVLKRRNRWYFGGDWDSADDAKLKIHTRKQLEEAGFGWVFDCPGIEIEEVDG